MCLTPVHVELGHLAVGALSPLLLLQHDQAERGSGSEQLFPVRNIFIHRVPVELPAQTDCNQRPFGFIYSDRHGLCLLVL
ncbi:hypothetical protein D3C73_1443340 [compost metagenome]